MAHAMDDTKNVVFILDKSDTSINLNTSSQLKFDDRKRFRLGMTSSL